MDSKQLVERLQPFLELSRQANKPLEIVRLDEALPGLPGNGYVVHLLAPWSADKSFGETMDTVLDFLWQTTDVALRTEIATLNVQAQREELTARFAGWV